MTSHESNDCFFVWRQVNTVSSKTRLRRKHKASVAFKLCDVTTKVQVKEVLLTTYVHSTCIARWYTSCQTNLNVPDVGIPSSVLPNTLRKVPKRVSIGPRVAMLSTMTSYTWFPNGYDVIVMASIPSAHGAMFFFKSHFYLIYDKYNYVLNKTNRCVQ